MKDHASIRSVVLFGYNAAERADDLRPLLASGWRIVPVPEGADRATMAGALAPGEGGLPHPLRSQRPPPPRPELPQVAGAGDDTLDLPAPPTGRRRRHLPPNQN